MKKAKTHFAQVPVETVKKIAVIEPTIGPYPPTDKRKLNQKNPGTKNGPRERRMTVNSVLELSGRETRKNNDATLKFPEWQIPLQELLLEFDSEKLPAKMEGVRVLIFARLKHLQDHYDRDEMQAINDAMNILRIVSRDKLESNRQSA